MTHHGLNSSDSIHIEKTLNDPVIWTMVHGLKMELYGRRTRKKHLILVTAVAVKNEEVESKHGAAEKTAIADGDMIEVSP